MFHVLRLDSLVFLAGDIYLHIGNGSLVDDTNHSQANNQKQASIITAKASTCHH